MSHILEVVLSIAPKLWLTCVCVLGFYSMCLCVIIFEFFLSESRHPTSAINEDTETRGSNCIRITDDCAFVAVRSAVNACARATAWQTEGSKMTVYSDVRAGFLWKDQGEVKRRCWMHGEERVGRRFCVCERKKMLLMVLRKPITSVCCPSWLWQDQ